MIDELLTYTTHINGTDEVKQWLSTTGKKALKKELITASDMEHILDYLCSNAAPKRLRKMSFKDAERKAEKWSKANQKKGRNLIDKNDDIETIHDFSDGCKIVKLKTKKALQREGFLMSHCVGGYNPDSSDYEIYSYRDKNNIPHATFEVRRNNNEIVQIKGKGNGEIHHKYIHPILEFLRSINMEVSKNEMKYLGYYYIDKDVLNSLKQYKSLNKRTTVINGLTYAF